MFTASLLALLATGTTLTLAHAPLPIITEAPLPLAVRQLDTSFPTTTHSINEEALFSCSSAFKSLADAHPTPTDPALNAWHETLPDWPEWQDSSSDTPNAISSWCSYAFASVWDPPPPASLVNAQSSYASLTASWETANAAQVTSLAGDCVQHDRAVAENILLLVASDGPACETAVSVGLGLAGVLTRTSSTGGPPGETGSGNSNGDKGGEAPSSTSSSTGGAAGPRETGFVAVMAVAAVGAVVGVGI
ncbi:hypothetical protein QBC38DRAFT_501346 [Podospora fimiseda]|uniref:Infection structure specific protein n=1 Tax=Podospora fimiseda TaxID=252190 RepID=A0AAN7GVR2_9PEZI|nr:hypothetical protein QBC38DRAFT_501346 [Podospora fimiseda]